MLDDVGSARGRATVRIGDFVYEPATGEVRPAAPGGAGGMRLPPQPARLLEILIEKDGELATREEIRAALWPDTHVDFDQGLHFCVRQIRSAFGDSASEPAYVETLPKRGYRLIPPVVPAGTRGPDPAEGGGRDGPDAGPDGRRRAWRRLALIGVAIALATAGLGLVRACRAPTGTPIRLAIMPFELAAEGGESEDLARLSEWLVVELSGGWAGRLEVIGPRSTAAYSGFPFPRLDRLAEDLSADFVLNARWLERDGESESELIVELIRLGDGAHPWAELFSDVRSWEPIALRVRDEVARSLGLSPGATPTDEE